MMLLRVEPVEPQEGRLCQVDEYAGHAHWDATAIVVGQFPLAGGIVELRLCARCWRKVLEDQQGGAGWVYTDAGREGGHVAEEHDKPSAGLATMVAEY